MAKKKDGDTGGVTPPPPEPGQRIAPVEQVEQEDDKEDRKKDAKKKHK